MAGLRKSFVVALLAAFIGIFTLSAAWLASVWAPDRSVAELQGRWAPPPSQWATIDGMPVHFRDEGPRDDPQPVVLLHGTSASLHTWDGWVRELQREHRIIRIDLPGFGLTGPAPDNDYRPERYIRFLTALYDHFGLQHTVLAGNSLGGGLAWRLALALPARVDKLILVDAAGYPMTTQSMPIAFRLARYPLLAPVLSRLLPRRLIEASVRNVYGDPGKVTPELLDRYYELSLRSGNRAALVERFRQTHWGDSALHIPEIRQPTLILWGGRDALIPPEHGSHFKQDIAGSQLVLFPELGHVPHEEDPVKTAAAVKAFLTGPAAKTHAP